MNTLSQQSRRFLGAFLLAPLVPLAIAGLLVITISSGNAWTGPVPIPEKGNYYWPSFCLKHLEGSLRQPQETLECFGPASKSPIIFDGEDRRHWLMCSCAYLMLEDPTYELRNYRKSIEKEYYDTPPTVSPYVPSDNSLKMRIPSLHFE